MIAGHEGQSFKGIAAKGFLKVLILSYQQGASPLSLAGNRGYYLAGWGTSWVEYMAPRLSPDLLDDSEVL